MGLSHSPGIIPDGLVFYFDPINPRSYAGTGLTGYNLIDTSIVGSFVGGAVYDVANKGSIYFDGVDDYIDFGSSTIFKLLDNFTLSAWVKSSVYGDRAILGNFGPSSDYSGFNLNIQPSNKFAFLTGSAATGTYLYSNDTFLLNKWYHLTAVRQNGTNYLYVNGAVQSSTNTQVVKYSNQNFYFAKWYSNLTGYYHNGQIASAAFYNRALSSTEILQNYNATKKRFSPEENIVKDGLVLHIDAGNNLSYAGTGLAALNIAGVGATGVLTNGVAFVANSGGSFVFDGTNDYIDCGNDSSLSALGGTTNITASAWAYYTAYGGGGQPYSVITVKGSPWTWLMENPSNTFTFRITAGGSDVNVVDTSTHLLNTWYNVVGTYDGSNMRIYVNGVLKNTRAQAGILGTNSETAKIGTYQGTNYNLTGRIANVSIYNKALSSTEILQNYNALKGRYGLS